MKNPNKNYNFSLPWKHMLIIGPSCSHLLNLVCFLVCTGKSLWFVSSLPPTLSFDFPIDMELFILIISNVIVILCILTKAYIPRKQYVKMGKVSGSFKEETSPAEWTLEILVVKVYGLFLCSTSDNVFNRGWKKCIFLR